MAEARGVVCLRIIGLLEEPFDVDVTAESIEALTRYAAREGLTVDAALSRIVEQEINRLLDEAQGRQPNGG